jgi:hypothetical protein
MAGSNVKRKDTRRLTLEFPTSVREQMERLRGRAKAATLAEVIRKALTAYDYLLAETERGGKVILRNDKDGEREVVLT